ALRPHLQAGQPPAAVPAGGSGLERRATRRRPGTVLPPLAGAEETPCGNGGGGGAQAGAAPVPHVAGRHRLRGVPAPGSRRAARPTTREAPPAPRRQRPCHPASPPRPRPTPPAQASRATPDTSTT